VLVTRSNFNSMDDLTSLSYHSSKSFTWLPNIRLLIAVFK
jgi:hypothetical protein